MGWWGGVGADQVEMVLILNWHHTVKQSSGVFEVFFVTPGSTLVRQTCDQRVSWVHNLTPYLTIDAVKDAVLSP